MDLPARDHSGPPHGDMASEMKLERQRAQAQAKASNQELGGGTTLSTGAALSREQDPLRRLQRRPSSRTSVDGALRQPGLRRVSLGLLPSTPVNKPWN